LVRVSAIHHFSFFFYSAQVLFISLIRKDFLWCCCLRWTFFAWILSCLSLGFSFNVKMMNNLLFIDFCTFFASETEQYFFENCQNFASTIFKFWPIFVERNDLRRARKKW
jgi:hypothetical protein